MTKNIAHRGFSGSYPENTMLAFEKAVEAGADSIELDVHLSSDGEVVVIHDETLDRTTNAKGLVSSFTLAQLGEFEIEEGQRIPTLAQYLAFIKPTGLLTNIEIKNDIISYRGIEEKTIALVREYGLEEKVIFSSFNHYSMLECRRLAPDIECGFLTYSWYINIGAYAKGHGVQYVHPLASSLSECAVKEIHSQGVGINTYTVNDPAEMRRLIALGVSGIITDYPDLLAKELGICAQ